MSKIRVSMKYIRNVWRKTFCCGYCDLQYIFRYEEPAYYNSGVYGWNCDIYCDYKRDIAITTGYRNMTGKRIPSELIKKYAEKFKSSYFWNSPCTAHERRSYAERLKL